jgi:hypothetical protein
MGFELVIGFIARLEITTTNNYSAIANSHILQFTIERVESSRSACLRRLSYNGFPPHRFISFHVSRLLSSLAGAYLTTRLSVATQRLTTLSLLRFPCLR